MIQAIIFSYLVFLVHITKANAVDEDLPASVKFYLTATSAHDCFFIVGNESSGEAECIGSFKIVLMANSEIFRNMLENSVLSDIKLPAIKPQIFKEFLICLYGGCDLVVRKMSFNECGELLGIARKYLVRTIEENLNSHIDKFLPLNVKDLFTAISNPDYLEILEYHVSMAILNYANDIFEDKDFLSLDDEALLTILKQDYLSVPELVVWDAVVKWGKHKCDCEVGQKVREQIDSVLKFIRFRTMDLKEFYQSVVPAQVLTPEEVVELSLSLVNKQGHNISGISNESQSRYVPHKVEEEPLIDYIQYFIPNITSLDDDRWYHSPGLEIGQYSWTISFKKTSSKFSCYVDSVQSSKVKQSSYWKCTADVNLVFVNQDIFCSEHYRLGTKLFDNTVNSWGYENLKNWHDILDPNQGFIKDNSILLQARIKLLSSE